MLVPDRANARWSLDFVSDAFTDGRRFRVLAVIDDYTRECLVLIADTSLSGARLPPAIRTDLDGTSQRGGFGSRCRRYNILPSFSRRFRDGRRLRRTGLRRYAESRSEPVMR
jgi:transposase InsO family protein